MRIIGGKHKGRILKPSMKKWPTRPTTDLSKEALYNILSNNIDFNQVSMLDLFGGTGAHALEFGSRGCTKICYVDNYHACVGWMKEIVATLELESYITIVKSDVRKFVKAQNSSYDIIIADPPYGLPWLVQIPSLIFAANLLSPDGILILEHGSQVSLSDLPHLLESRKYGQSTFSFFQHKKKEHI